MKTNRQSPDIDRLVEDNQGLVYHLAMKVFRRLPVRQDLDDLVGYGMIGLVEAAKKYQPKRGIEFTTFAYPRINGAIYDGVSKLSWMSRSRYKRLMKLKAQAEEEGDTETSDRVSEDMMGVSSLDPETVQAIVSDEQETAETNAVRDEEHRLLSQLIEKLPNREKRLITMIYIEGLTLQDASERIGISKSWASRMHSKTLTKLSVDLRS